MPEPFLPALVAVIERYETEVADESDDLHLLKEQAARGDALERRDTWPGHLTTSAIVLDPDQRQVLLILHRRLQRWLQPGGHYEHAPFFWQSAEREGVEETGLPSIVRHRWHGGTDLPVDIELARHSCEPAARRARAYPSRHAIPVHGLAGGDAGTAMGGGGRGGMAAAGGASGNLPACIQSAPRGPYSLMTTI